MWSATLTSLIKPTVIYVVHWLQVFTAVKKYDGASTKLVSST